MKLKGENYCDWCFITFGSAEPRRHRIVENPEGGLEKKSYHLQCFHLLELKEMIAKTAKREIKIKNRKQITS